MIINVRRPANFAKETIPGAINVPLEQLEGYLKKISKDTYIVFTCYQGSQAAKLAEDLGFTSTTFYPVSGGRRFYEDYVFILLAEGKIPRPL